MPWDGNGNYLDVGAPDFPAVAGLIIYADQFNTVIQDLLLGIQNTIAKDGQNTPTDDLPMGSHKHTGAAAAAASGEYLVYGQAGGVLANLTITGELQVGSTIPQVAKSTAYTLVLTDAGKHIYHPSADGTARVWTIPANASVAFPIGAAVTFVNGHGAGVITIAINTDTLRWAADGSTGSRTLAANGMATAIKVTATEWKITGEGLT